MSIQSELPPEVSGLLRSAVVSEFATISAAGVPIDTPILCLTPDDLATVDLATGIAYPAKAERARRNPRVGLLIEGMAPGEPVISIAGLASVRDADIQANALRYIAETASGGAVIVPWETAREAVWYWSRIIIEVTPVRVLWWASRDLMDGPPQRWEATAGTVSRPSDPAPAGSISAAPKWGETPWRELAAAAAASTMPAHLTLLDEHGFPLPFRVADIVVTDAGSRFCVPAGAPWQKQGKATLSYEGRSTFVGEATLDGAEATMTVERTLPMVADLNELWTPSPTTREPLMARLRHELARRGQTIPAIPDAEPAPTKGAQARKARIERLKALAG
ncbi:MAG: hypothetical protein JOY99_05410 [Sphingomonadaceae bacterium]|nr:hypothetical protein [Sphingomonadaceae bacterium]